METPSSTRRITRSQALASANNSNNNIPMSRKFEETEKGMSKSRQRAGKQQDRSALFDITNDSPIVGLAKGNLDTPLSKFSKKMFNVSSNHMATPGSGEALLRGQVKTLLQKVEEEAVVSKIPVEYRQFLNHHGIVCSPMALIAPTPTNTPQVSDFSGDGSSVNNVLASISASPVEEQFKFSQMINEIIEGKRQDSVESEKNLITRSLFFDFSEKTEDSVSSDCNSELTYQGECVSEGSKEIKSSADDDDASVWSIEVNASTQDDEEEQGDEEDSELDYDEESKEEEYYDGDRDDSLDELCEGISKISVNGVEFTGKHTRFVYNCDDEFEGEVGETSDSGVLRLKGLPTPKGKHLRFADEEGEE